MNKWTVTLSLPLILLFCGGTFADQVTLKNGDRLTGKLVRSDGKFLLLLADLIGEVKIALDNVTAFSSDKPLWVALADGRTVHGLLAASDDKVEIRSTNTDVAVSRSAVQVIRSDDEQQAYLSSLNPGLLEGWTGGADIGFALTKGNSDTSNLALGLAMARETLHDKTSLYSAAVYNRESTAGLSRTIANTLRFGARYDRDLNRRYFVYGFTDLERNGLQQLNLRWVLGGGFGYHAIREERTNLDLLAGLAMNREYFKGIDNDRTSPEVQIGQTLAHDFNARMSLKEQLFFFPNLSNGGEYRINFDTALVTSVTRRINWQLTLSDRYLSNPPLGFKQNDLLLTTGLGVKLGKIKD